MKPSHRPALSAEQMDMIRFLLLDGCAIRAGSSHPTIRVYSSDRTFLEAAREVLGWAANDVHTHRTAEAAARQMRENFGADVSAEDCTATYGLATRPLPKLDGFEGPTDVERLSPRLLKWLIARSGRYVGIPIFPNVHLDVRDMDATEGHMRRLLSSHGVQTGRQTDSSMFIPTRHDGVVAIPSEGVQQIKNRFGIEITPESDERAHVVPEEAEGDFPEAESV
ncbi:hypothetical protein PNQ92_11160 [Halobacterium salinarum]|uniref:hypothetical protein n=1 Tax=Halobacterium salinarum TaxID=2242 RepID=UPI00255234F4|nr:hypothetical protein [Halobacterium salinarum]MDL0125964.1 hypothetical protein [Halobacterium salinarum]